MHDDSITQSEIDALVKGLTGGADPTCPPVDQVDSGPLAEPFREFLAAGSTAFTEMVTAPCRSSVRGVTLTNLSEASQLMQERVHVARFSLTSGTSGAVYLVVPEATAIALIMQIYGGVSPSAMDESAISALADGLSQIAIAGLSRWGDLLNRPLVTGPVEMGVGGSLLTITGENTADIAVVVASVQWSVVNHSGPILVVVTEDVLLAVEMAIKERNGAKGRHQTAGISAAAADHMEGSTGGRFAAPAKLQQSSGQGVTYQNAKFPELNPNIAREEIRNIDLLMDVTLQVTVELGRTRRQIKDVLTLGPGSVLELDKLAGEQVDVLVNGKLIAKGEVVVIDENYGVRITDILSPVERVQSFT